MPDSSQTVITTFECAPDASDEILRLLVSAYDDVISKREGFLNARLHVNDARTRICNVSHWRAREDFQAMLRSEEMVKRNQVITGLAKGFEPVMYDEAASYGG